MSATIQPVRGVSPRDRRALTVGALTLGILLFYTWGLRPWAASLTARRDQVAQQANLLSRERALVQAAAQFPRARSQVTQVLNTSRSRLFVGDAVSATASLASYVDDLATATGVHVTSIEGRSPAQGDALSNVSVELRGEARFASVLSFLRAAESAGYLLTVPALRLERASRGDLLTITATLSGAAVSVP